MDRRSFATFAAAAVLWASARPVRGATGPAAAEPFRIRKEDYRKVAPEFLPQLVEYPTAEAAGTIVVDPENRFLYLVLGAGQAKRYGVGVGREGFGWSGIATVKRKAEWPKWIPPKAMMARSREAARWPNGMPGGPENPLGARALYLYQGEVDTLFRIHGTREPESIGRAASSGCIRMLNADVAELFDRVPLGTRVIVLGQHQHIAVSGESRDEAIPTAFQRSGGGPVVASPGEEQATRTALTRLRARRRRKPSVTDWLRSLEDSDYDSMDY